MIAHINNEGLQQTVEDHLIMTARKAEENARTLNLSNTVFLAGMVHDIGKYSDDFFKYLLKATNEPSSVRRGEVDHSTSGGKLIYERYYNDNQLQMITAQLIAIAVTSHHGLYDSLNLEGEDVFTRRMNKSEEINYNEVFIRFSESIMKDYDIDKLYLKSKNEINDILSKIKEIEMDMEDNKSLFFLISCLERIILSVLIDADHADTAEFMNNIKANEQSIKNTTILWKELKNNLDLRLSNFKSNDKISILRKTISDECEQFSINNTGIYCLSIPTGGGKTLSGLRYAIEHAIKHNKDHIVYVAPYLSILEQNADEYRNALNADEYILEHHSNVFIEADDRYDYLKETWDSPIILTTMVQFLNTLFSDSTQSIRRMNRLANSVIIIDEIQSIPIRCINLFNTMMNFLTKICNSTIILCSATQPLLGTTERKILYSFPKDITENAEKQFHDFKRTEIANSYKRGGYDIDDLTDFIMSKMNNLDNLLIILNTKSAVKNVYDKLQKIIKVNNYDIELVQLTTYMCAENRSDIVRRLKNILGKERVICISTQLIEAGVDISFQCVIRSLAGLDSIAQAAGRCNRNGETGLGYVYMINYKEENLSSLNDIKIAQDATLKVLDEFIDKEKSDALDLLSPKAMDMFYEIYFFKRMNEMNYTIKEKNTTIYDLLSTNPIGTKAYKERNNKLVPIQLKQAFKSAGENFQVIENNTVGLLVPYRDGKESIEIIKNSFNKKDIFRELKKMQRYTVNVYATDTVLKKLIARNAVDDSVLDGQILILREGFYDEKVGVCNGLEDLIF